jgi:hypothetical protein
VGLGQKTPAVTLIGTGQSHRDAPLIAKLKFADGCRL